MMPPEEARASIVQGWLLKANEDFAVAEYLISSKRPYYGAVGFHAQQAVEKYLKALLACRQIEFPKTHDLDKLLDILACVDETLAESLRDITVLSVYGVETRYPADLPDLTLSEATEAVRLATNVKDVIERAVKASD